MALFSDGPGFGAMERLGARAAVGGKRRLVLGANARAEKPKTTQTTTRSTSSAPTAPPSLSVDQALLDYLAGLFGSSGGGGGGPYVDPREMERIRFENELALLREQERLRKEREAEQQRQQLLNERSALFAQLLGTNPVRAALLGLGLGGRLIPGGERFAGLPPLQGAEQQRQQVQAALTGILGTPISLGAGGLVGLPTVEQAARAFQFGGLDTQKLLSDAFSVGLAGIGLSQDELLRRIAEVTPQGILQ